MTGADCYRQMFVTLLFYSQPRSTLSWLFPVETVCDGVITHFFLGVAPGDMLLDNYIKKIRNICTPFVCSYVRILWKDIITILELSTNAVHRRLVWRRNVQMFSLHLMEMVY